MGNYFSLQQALAQIGTVRFADIVDIVMVAVLFYFIISLIRTTQTFRVFMGIVVIMLALWISGELQLYTVNYLLRNAVQIGLLGNGGAEDTDTVLPGMNHFHVRAVRAQGVMHDIRVHHRQGGCRLGVM